MPATNVAEGPNQRQAGFNLFLVGFLILFLELACIRWFSAKVVFLQFFTNIVLLAAFLGMSCGCLAARRTTNWLALFPGLALVTFAAVALGGIAVLGARLVHWLPGVVLGLAAGLALGLDVPAATAAAHEWLHGAILAADGLGVGSGHGPVHHFHAWWPA